MSAANVRNPNSPQLTTKSAAATALPKTLRHQAAKRQPVPSPTPAAAASAFATPVPLLIFAAAASKLQEQSVAYFLSMTEDERIASNLPVELLDGLKGAVAEI